MKDVFGGTSPAKTQGGESKLPQKCIFAYFLCMGRKYVPRGMSNKRTTYAHKEAYGNFNADDIKAIAEFFNVTVEYIIKGINNPLPPVNSPYNLTVDEKILLELFNKLTPEQQKEFLLELAKK